MPRKGGIGERNGKPAAVSPGDRQDIRRDGNRRLRGLHREDGWSASPIFARLWLVGLVVFSVRWLEMLAVAVFAYQHTGSPFIVALLTMLRMLPMALFGAADRRHGRARGTAHGTRPRHPLDAAVLDRRWRSLAWSGALEVWHLALAEFHQRHRLDHRQPGAPHDDRRGRRPRAR